MRAGLRWTTVLLGNALVFLAVPVLAQSTASAQPTTAQATDSPPPPSDAIGPRELQNFSLKGTVTKPADQQAPPTITTAPVRSATSSVTATPKAPPLRLTEALPPRREAAGDQRSVSAPTALAPTAAPAVPPPLQQTETPAPAPLAETPARSLSSAPETIAPEHKLSLAPWLLAALALAGGMLFLLWRRRPREALAGGAEFDLFVAPEPAPAAPLSPAPRTAGPQPTPERPKPAVQKGIVATRLRPQVEIAVQPLRCLVDGDQVTLEFELELFNAGAAPARAVHAETALFNAGGAQDRELAAFFANPVGSGERLEAIPPMKRVAFASKVIAPRSAIQEYELGGRKTIVPVLAFNTLYEWSGGRAQTSAAYLVGRETKNDKLGPLAVNGTAREFRGLAVHVLPAALRT